MRKYFRIAGRNLRANRRSFKVEEFTRTLDTALVAHFLDDEVPARRKITRQHFLADGRSADPKSLRHGLAPEGDCDLFCGLHGVMITPLVDIRKTTIGSSPNLLGAATYAPMVERPDYSKIGQRLASVRTHFGGLTQKAWAERNGFNLTQYNHWERGTRRIPVDAAERLADNYGLSLDFIYRGRRDTLPETLAKSL